MHRCMRIAPDDLIASIPARSNARRQERRHDLAAYSRTRILAPSDTACSRGSHHTQLRKRNVRHGRISQRRPSQPHSLANITEGIRRAVGQRISLRLRLSFGQTTPDSRHRTSPCLTRRQSALAMLRRRSHAEPADPIRPNHVRLGLPGFLLRRNPMFNLAIIAFSLSDSADRQDISQPWPTPQCGGQGPLAQDVSPGRARHCSAVDHSERRQIIDRHFAPRPHAVGLPDCKVAAVPAPALFLHGLRRVGGTEGFVAFLGLREVVSLEMQNAKPGLHGRQCPLRRRQSRPFPMPRWVHPWEASASRNRSS